MRWGKQQFGHQTEGDPAGRKSETGRGGTD